MADQPALDNTETKAAGPPWHIQDVGAWPGAFGAFKYSQSAVILNIAPLIILYAIGIVSGMFRPVLPTALYGLVSFVISVLLYVVEYNVYLASAQGTKLDIGEAFKKSFDGSTLLNMIGLGFMVFVVIGFGFLLFIIPGLIILPRLVLSPYFLLDKKLDCVEAFKASWETTRGHSLKVWGTIGAAFLMVLPVFTIIGIPVAIYLLFMYSAVGAVLYEYIKRVGPSKDTASAKPITTNT